MSLSWRRQVSAGISSLVPPEAAAPWGTLDPFVDECNRSVVTCECIEGLKEKEHKLQRASYECIQQSLLFCFSSVNLLLSSCRCTTDAPLSSDGRPT